MSVTPQRQKSCTSHCTTIQGTPSLPATRSTPSPRPISPSSAVCPPPSPPSTGLTEQAAIEALMQWKRKRQAMLERRQRVLAECFRIVKACNWPVALPPASPPSPPESPAPYHAAPPSPARHTLSDPHTPVGLGGGSFDQPLLHSPSPPRNPLKTGRDMRYNVPRLDPMGLGDGESLMMIGALHRGTGPATDAMPRGIGSTARAPARPSGVSPGAPSPTSPKPSFRSLRPPLGTLSHGIGAAAMQDQLVTGAGLEKGDVDRAAWGVRCSSPRAHAVAPGTTCGDVQ